MKITSFAQAFEQLEKFDPPAGGRSGDLGELRSLYDRLGLDERVRAYLHGVVTHRNGGPRDGERFSVFMLGLVAGLLALEHESAHQS